MNKVIIFSAPSGSGKTTVVNHLLSVMPELGFSVSATTRKPRPHEQNGREYYFLDENDFKKKVENNEFLESEEVYTGILYGTLNSEVQRLWDLGKTVIFDVDVAGGVRIKQKFGDNALSIFLRPPSIEILMERLKKRSTEVEHQMQMRIDKAQYELNFENQYDIVLINDKLEETLAKAEEIVKNFINS
ncbi:MAG: guanylate kinase [Bacteroidia bacterium]|nr:guanylate kinase [Bacteroidia bacterium]